MNSENEIKESDIVNMLEDTTAFILKEKLELFQSAASASVSANHLTNGVEFWKWMGRNYPTKFGTAELIQKTMQENPAWARLQIQGKGLEWDFMTKKRGELENIHYKFVAGDSPTQPGTDVDKIGLFTRRVKERFQMKAYTGAGNPDLSNTPKTAKVIVPKEKISYVKRQGHNPEGFSTKKGIIKKTDQRVKAAQSGAEIHTYNVSNVSAAMAKAGAMGCVVGVTTESVFSYKRWKMGELSDKQYFTEVLKAGGDAGLTATASSGIMIPVSAAITAAGGTALVTIPVGIVVGGLVNKVVAPIFARGDYKKILSKSKYYQNLEGFYSDMTASMKSSAEFYEEFIFSMKNQQRENNKLKKESDMLDIQLSNLYDSI
ncbi:hypothetical protein [Proteiniclasticum ruminis]|uniref:Uncharacterized protein n=1 Tax=Proteiniclasticum ruminis TaxID=398199 RepID=A0A1G8LTC6_9CLOT|nr:hypothetical protein [Proteiniclasticum ruminis]SDI58959.1 hypothetical protein SAMN05421804_103180 [Proteiniclasticum ruminis]